jgi:hypothetical protein
MPRSPNIAKQCQLIGINTVFKYLTIAASAVMLAACMTPVRYEGVNLNHGGLTELLQMDQTTRASVDALAAQLRKLSPAVSAQDAATLAREAHTYPMHLANVWQVSSPPLLNNYMRNQGKVEYGLCIDWTYAMRQRMRGLGLDSFDWFWGIANEGSELREHSTLVAVAKGAPFEQGVVLDPWRNSGKLFWAAIGKDPKYDWKPYTEPEGWTPSRVEGL